MDIPLCSFFTTKLWNFGMVFLIFLSLPYVGKLRKIKKPSKICIVWSVEASKVKCQEIAGIHKLAFSLNIAVLMHLNGPKCPRNE